MAMKIGEKIKKILPIVFIFLVSFFFILPFLVTKTIPYAGDFTGSDLTELNLPLRSASAQSILSGHVPLWNHNLSNGFALLAEGQAGVFYPLNLIYLFLPFTLAVNIGFFLNFFLAGFFTYLYARALSLSRLASIFSALAFSFSGFFIFHIKHLNMINAAIWVPLIFYLIEKYFFSQKKKRFLVFIALVFSIQFFAGHPQISYLSVISGFVYFLLRFCFEITDLKKVSVDEWIIKILLPWIFIGVMALGLSAIQFLPTLEISALSERNTWIDYETSTNNIFPPRQILTVLNPYLFGNAAINNLDGHYQYLDIFWENNCYFGFLSAIFAILALICLIKSDKRVRLFAVMIFILLFFIFGRYNFLYIFVWLILPGLKFFRFSQRFILPLMLIFSILAGVGFDLVKKIAKIILEKYSDVKKVKLAISTLSILFILFILLDIFTYARQYVSALPQDYFKPNPVSTWLSEQNQKEKFSYLSIDWQDSWSSVIKNSGGWQNTDNIYLYRNLIPPNLNIFFDLSTSDDRPWLEGGQLYEPMAKLWLTAREHQIPNNQKSEMVLDDTFLEIYGMQGVKYFLSHFSLNNNNLKLIKTFSAEPLPDIKVYENPFFLPKAFIVNNYAIEKNQIKFLEKVSNDFYDFNNEIVLAEESKIPTKEGSNNFGWHNVENIYWSDNKVEIIAKVEEESLLFLSLTKYPGWQVKINGKEGRILTANCAFSAVELPVGESHIVFEFKPISFYLGALITFVTVFVLLAGSLLLFYFKKLRKV